MSVLKLEPISIAHNFMLDRIQCRQNIIIHATNIRDDVLKIGDSYQFVNVASTKLLGSNRKMLI